MNKVAIVGLGFFSMVMLIALCVVLGSIWLVIKLMTSGL